MKNQRYSRFSPVIFHSGQSRFGFAYQIFSIGRDYIRDKRAAVPQAQGWNSSGTWLLFNPPRKVEDDCLTLKDISRAVSSVPDLFLCMLVLQEMFCSRHLSVSIPRMLQDIALFS